MYTLESVDMVGYQSMRKATLKLNPKSESLRKSGAMFHSRNSFNYAGANLY